MKSIAAVAVFASVVLLSGAFVPLAVGTSSVRAEVPIEFPAPSPGPTDPAGPAY